MLSGIFGYLIHYSDDIDSHRTFADTTAATGALVHPRNSRGNTEICGSPAGAAGHRCSPADCVRTSASLKVGENWPVIPRTHPLSHQSALPVNFVVDVEAMAGRAQNVPDAAADTGTRHLLPQRRIEIRLQFGRRPVRVVNLALRISHCVGMHLLDLFLVRWLQARTTGCRQPSSALCLFR